MNHALRSFLLLGLMACATSCESSRLAAAPVIPEFSGGGNGTEVSNKKARLVAEYEELALVESRLRRESSSLAAMQPGRRGSPGVMAIRRGSIAMDTRKAARHRATIGQLHHELNAAGVTVTTHR